MSQFSRRARWLNALFPSSVAPQRTDPSVVSEDVSLVQQYDAGGMAFEQATFPPIHDTATGPLEIRQPEVSIRDFQTVVGITTVSDLFNLDQNLVARIYGCSITVTDGIGAERVFLQVTAPTGSGVGAHVYMFSESLNTVSNPGDLRRFNNDPILLPDMQLNLFFSSGDALSTARVSVCMCVAPVGTVFRI